MDIKIAFSDDPTWVSNTAGAFLASHPVLHNLILTLLRARAAKSEPGRYWVAMDGSKAVGVTLQSPVSYPAHLTPMESSIAAALVNAIAEAGVALPGVIGDAATAAVFAGQWTERCKSAATPFQGSRLYELMEMGKSPAVAGQLRQALAKDRKVIIDWTRAFQREIGEPDDDTEIRVDQALAVRQLWLWENNEAVSMAMSREPVESVVRISGVYTPVGSRGCGYAEACVHALSKQFRDAGYRCILYTDLANPTSNSIYRRIGYRAVAEVLRYRFE
jgi:predicted GNAT family acetyltransferase